MLGFGVMVLAYGVYGFFRKTSLATPLRIFGWGLFLFIFHEFVHVYGEYNNLDVEEFYEWVEVAFVAVMLLGFYTFKSQFEKFEWVREISASTEIISKA